jgi:hypothetical protein
MAAAALSANVLRLSKRPLLEEFALVGRDAYEVAGLDEVFCEHGE